MALWGARILAVAGSDLETLHLIRLVQDAGGQIEIVGTRADALAAVHDQRPDLVLVDLDLPGLDGFELLRRIRRMPVAQGGRVAAASLSAEPLGRRLAAWRTAGFQLHASKPLDREELLAVMETITGRIVERRRRALLPDQWPAGVEGERRGAA